MTETGEPIRVLVTEDDDGYRRLSERLLTDAGFVVDAADSGPEALRRIPEQMPE